MKSLRTPMVIASIGEVASHSTLVMTGEEMSDELRVPGCELRVPGCELRVCLPEYGMQSTNSQQLKTKV